MKSRKTFDKFIRTREECFPNPLEEIVTDFKKAFDLEIICLPADDPLNGSVGYTLFRVKDCKEDMVTISRKIWSKAKDKKVTTKKELERIYNEAVASDWIINRCDDPKKLILGFIVSKGSGRIWYHITLDDLKKSTVEGK